MATDQPPFSAADYLLLRAGLSALLRSEDPPSSDAASRIVALRARLRETPAEAAVESPTQETSPAPPAAYTFARYAPERDADGHLVLRDSDGRIVLTDAASLHRWIQTHAPELSAQYTADRTLHPQPASVVSAIDKAVAAQTAETQAMFERAGHPFADPPAAAGPTRSVDASPAADSDTYVHPRKVAELRSHPTLPGWTYSHTDAEGDHYTNSASPPDAASADASAPVHTEVVFTHGGSRITLDVVDDAHAEVLIRELAREATPSALQALRDRLASHPEGSRGTFTAPAAPPLVPLGAELLYRAALTAAHHALATLQGLIVSDPTPGWEAQVGWWEINEGRTIALIDAALAGGASGETP